LNTDMRKFETSQKEESRAQSADFSKDYIKPSRAFSCSLFACFLLFQTVLSTMGVSKESISKFLIGNRFHVKLLLNDCTLKIVEKVVQRSLP